MKTREKIWTDREDLKLYRTQINLDGRFLKAQSIILLILLLALLLYLLSK